MRVAFCIVNISTTRHFYRLSSCVAGPTTAALSTCGVATCLQRGSEIRLIWLWLTQGGVGVNPGAPRSGERRAALRQCGGGSAEAGTDQIRWAGRVVVVRLATNEVRRAEQMGAVVRGYRPGRQAGRGWVVVVVGVEDKAGRRR